MQIGLGLALQGLLVQGAAIIGFSGGTTYSINAQNGAIAAIGAGAGIALSSGPVAGSILLSSGVNIYQLDVSSGQQKLYACPVSPCASGDHAFNSSTNTIYAIGTLPGSPNFSLFRLLDSGIPQSGIPNSTQVSYSLIGNLGLDTITAIEYMPSLGLIATDGTSLYRVNAITGQTNFLIQLAIVLPFNPPFGIAKIDSLAYDPDTDRLIGSSQHGIGLGGFEGQARLYNINMVTGIASWLNESPPSFAGIAGVNAVPEPTTIELVTFGLALYLLRIAVSSRCA